MRILSAVSLAGLALASLAACNKSPPAPAASSGQAPAAAAAPAASGPVTLNQVPHRKAGLWKQEMSMDGAPAGMGGMQLCVDEASEARTSAFAQHMPGKTHCDPPQISRGLDGSTTFTDVCDMGARGKATTTGTIKGDFNSSYTEDVDVEYSGGAEVAVNGPHKMSITATWLGPCPAGDRGGDMIMPGGMKINAMDHRPAQAGGE